MTWSSESFALGVFAAIAVVKVINAADMILRGMRAEREQRRLEKRAEKNGRGSL